MPFPALRWFLMACSTLRDTFGRLSLFSAGGLDHARGRQFLRTQLEGGHSDHYGKPPPPPKLAVEHLRGTKGYKSPAITAVISRFSRGKSTGLVRNLPAPHSRAVAMVSGRHRLRS